MEVNLRECTNDSGGCGTAVCAGLDWDDVDFDEITVSDSDWRLAKT